MKNKLFINNYLEDITINFKDMTEKDAKKVAYYLLQGDEWKRFGVDSELITIMKIDIERKDTKYLFKILYGQGIPTRELIRKTAQGIVYDNINNLSCNMIVNEKQEDIELTKIIRELYELTNGNIIRTVEDILNNKIIKTNNMNTNNIYPLTLEQLAQEDFENISLSYKKSHQYTLNNKR